VYTPCVKDIMDKYYEMVRGEKSTSKKEFFISPDSPDHSDQDSDTDGWSTEEKLGDHGSGWMRRSELCVRETSLSFIKITQSLVYQD
jgi:hypothetical protein